MQGKVRSGKVIFMVGTQKRLKDKVRAYKMGKTCEMCGSEFDLTVHHEGNPYVNHKDKMKDPKLALTGLVVLCRTCHYEVDFDHNMQFYHRAGLRRYNESMEKLEKRWKIGRFAKHSGRGYSGIERYKEPLARR